MSSHSAATEDRLRCEQDREPEVKIQWSITTNVYEMSDDVELHNHMVNAFTFQLWFESARRSRTYYSKMYLISGFFLSKYTERLCSYIVQAVLFQHGKVAIDLLVAPWPFFTNLFQQRWSSLKQTQNIQTISVTSWMKSIIDGMRREFTIESGSSTGALWSAVLNQLAWE